MLCEYDEGRDMTGTAIPNPCRVALLAGGSSAEREVSLESAQGVIEPLTEAGFDPTLLDPSRKEDVRALVDGDFDVAFLCLHGGVGENGAIQGFLEVLGLPYTGSGICASALAIDKGKAKVMFDHAQLRTPFSVTVDEDSSYDADELADSVGLPCVVKPTKEGSSYGVFLVESEAALTQALADAFAYDSAVLVEQYISGTELTISVLGNDEPFALPIIEVVPQSDFYDYESKYATGGSQHICPARLQDEKADEVQELAVRAHKALGCAGVSRSDFILDEAGDAWILETNTIPGMTGTSLLPDAAHVAGIEFPDLCKRLIEYALEKND